MTKAERRAAYRFDRFTLDLDRGTLLTSGGAELPLRPKAFALLQLFVENAGRLLDRDTIMQAIWPDVFVTDDSITQCVGDIRRALGDEAQHLLRTVPRRGYLFAELSPAEPATPVPDVDDLSPQPSATRGPAEPAGASTVAKAERRQLTVLSCGPIGSTALAERLDPEDLSGIIRTRQARCTAEIVRLGGHVATCLGDGILAYFGYPQAYEDAAERAVRAGLAIVRAADDPKLGLDATVQMRVGIATGLVVSDTIDSVPGELAVGKPLNLAAQLQAVAEPGAVLIAESTRRLVGELFVLKNRGRRFLKGFTAPVQAWQVTGDSAAESRFEALRGASLAPLVGRRQELALLLDRWKQAKEGEGQAVLLAGAPGIGKSRLIRALRDRLAGEPHAYLGYYCAPHRQDSPLQPVIAHLERAAGFTRDDDPGRKLAKLAALLAQGSEDAARMAPLLMPLLSIPTGRHYPLLEMSPQRQRERTLAALVDQLAGLATHRPVLLVWEDVHWADPTSLELLGLTIDRLQFLPVLALVTFRPEFTPFWSGHTHATSLTLNRLSRESCSRLVMGLTGGRPLPATVLDQIAAKTDGVPLFIEELTKAVLEAGIMREESGRYMLERPLLPMAVPATLHDSLMARLDHLAPIKEVAQVASVIGREFSYELLAAIADRDQDELTEALRQLTAAELVFRRSHPSHISYVFKHALVRDAAYASLLKSRRRQLHKRIAEVLEEHFPHVAESEPEVLAHHWGEASVASKAAVYRQRAGEQALARSATTEALAELALGLEILQGCPDDPERQCRELSLQVAMGAALVAAKGPAAPETAQAYMQAAKLCRQLGEQRRLVPVLFGLWASHNVRDEPGAARVVAAELLGLAEQGLQGAAAALGHRALGTTLLLQGEFATSRTHLERLLALDRSTAGPVPAFPYPFDPWVTGKAYLSVTLLLLGHPEQALARADEALAEAQRLAHHNSLALTLFCRCVLDQLVRDRPNLAAHAEALSTLAAEQGFAYWLTVGTIFHGWALVEDGELAAGIARMQEGLAACRATGAKAYVPDILGMIAEAHRRAGDIRQAQKLLAEALDHVVRMDSRHVEAELHRLQGELLLASTPPDQAGVEASFRRAIDLARGQQARWWELRAALSLARLWHGQGKRSRAHELLASIYAQFREGFDLADLRETRAWLDTLDPTMPARDDPTCRAQPKALPLPE
jgi:predicted ATPase/class 3 adenylate cyclase/DNA-binding winged helix-turn-helix (wHTH) protein